MNAAVVVTGASVGATRGCAGEPVVRRAARAAGARVRALVERWQRHRAYVRTVSELSSLGDHTLRDLGIDRGLIPAVARAMVEPTSARSATLPV